MTKAIVALAIPLAVGGSAGAKSPAVPNISAAKIQFIAPVFDFGTIAAGTRVKHDYIFTNTGTAPLIVTGVVPSCDCTTAEKWSTRVEAGKTGVVPIQFDSTGYGGPIDKWILVTSNDSSRHPTELVLKGRVWEPIDVVPSNAVFTPAAGTLSSETKIIRITNHTGHPLLLSPPESSNRAFLVQLKTIHPGTEYELRVEAVPPFGAGPVRGLITIKTNSGEIPMIAVTAVTLVRKSAGVRQEGISSAVRVSHVIPAPPRREPHRFPDFMRGLCAADLIARRPASWRSPPTARGSAVIWHLSVAET